jgi:Mrp family chromosome partitioning ATPase
LIDLDLKRSAMAATIGVHARKSIGQYLLGQAAFEECFVRIGDSLILGLNDYPVKNSAEMMHDQRVKDMLKRVSEILDPGVVLFDLPPLLASDDALAFLPQVDCSLLVIASGTTSVADVEQCERECAAANNFLGVVLNKSPERLDAYYERAT